jgi:peroxiredoxin
MRQIKPGDFLEPCVLESVQGTEIPIPPPAQIMLHIQFRRFAGCPICNLHLQSFIRRHRELVNNQIQEVVVFHSPKSAMLEHQLSAPFPFVADPDKNLYKAFGVKASIMSVLNPKAWPAAVKGLIEQGPGFPSRGESALGLPGDFLIDSAGMVLTAHYGKHASDQLEFDELLELVCKARQHAPGDDASCASLR